MKRESAETEVKDTMDKRKNLYRYVLDHIDEAIEKRWIQVYYQPVARTISRALCGMEALARWQDPELGFLTPADFIPALEESRQIAKLDMYVVREVCRKTRDRIDHNEAVVPISFNLSKLDFETADVCTIISKATDVYKIPRDMLHAELTESTFNVETDVISREIDRLRDAGFLVSMDDFGTGYSSLNVLKDYTFDLLKIDMKFLSSTSRKSRLIIESVIRMAKNIGIQTLTEGVETEEQYEYLREIGCEKVQGYYFSKPAPYEEAIANCLLKNMDIENQAWRNYYDTVGKVDFLTDRSLALVEDDGKKFHYVFLNNAYLLAMRSDGINNVDLWEQECNAPGSPTHYLHRQIVEGYLAKGDSYSGIYPSASQTMHLQARVVARCNGHSMIQLRLNNVVEDEETKKRRRDDEYLRYLYYICSDIALLDFEEDTVVRLKSSNPDYPIGRQEVLHGIQDVLNEFGSQFVYPADRSRYFEYADMANIRRRLSESRSGLISDYYRCKNTKGEFEWIHHATLAIPKSSYSKVLIATANAGFTTELMNKTVFDNYYRENNITGGRLGDMDIDNIEQTVWNNIKENTKVKVFWKDKQRRFVGVNQAFLDYYGLKSQDDVIGKTDEDMKWHVDDEPFKNDEADIISKGIHTQDVPGKCIINNRIHDIYASKMPLYRGGKIVGLVGYFEDAARIDDRKKNNYRVVTTDSITGACNLHGLMESVIEYQKEKYEKGIDYVIMTIDVHGCDYFRSIYGGKAAAELLREIVRILRKDLKEHTVIGRLPDGHFMAITQYDRQLDVVAASRALKKDIRELRSAGGNPCTCSASIELTYAASAEHHGQSGVDVLNQQVVGLLHK